MLQTLIGRIGIFIICAQALMQFRPKETYGKYLRLLFSVMILIQVIQPFSALFFGGSELELQRSVQEFQSSMEESMEKAALRAAEAQAQLEKKSMKEVQERIAIAPVEEIVITLEEEHE